MRIIDVKKWTELAYVTVIDPTTKEKVVCILYYSKILKKYILRYPTEHPYNPLYPKYEGLEKNYKLMHCKELQKLKLVNTGDITDDIEIFNINWIVRSGFL